MSTHTLTTACTFPPHLALPPIFRAQVLTVRRLAYASSSILSGPLAVVNYVLQELILPVQNALNCITIPSLNTSAMAACPGYSLYGGPTGPVAKGAIQN